MPEKGIRQQKTPVENYKFSRIISGKQNYLADALLQKRGVKQMAKKAGKKKAK